MIPFPIINTYNNKVVLNNIKDIRASQNNTIIILMQDGTLYGFGDNLQGELGQGNKSPYPNYIQIDTGVDAIWGGVASCMYRKDGKYYASGLVTFQGSANVTYTTYTDVTSVFGSLDQNNIKKIDYDNPLYVLMNDGTLYGCGANTNGQLGTGNTTRVNSITQIQTGVTDFKLIPGGCAFILKGNTMYSTGANNRGQLGCSTTLGNITSFTQITKFSSVQSLDNLAGTNSVTYYNDSGTVYASGSSDSYRYGDSSSGVSTTLFSKVITTPSTFNGKIYTTKGSSGSSVFGCTDGLYQAGASIYGFGSPLRNITTFTKMNTLDFTNSNEIDFVIGHPKGTYYVIGYTLYSTGAANNVPGNNAAASLSFMNSGTPSS